MSSWLPYLVYGEEILAEHIELFGSSKKLKVMKHCGSVINTSTTDSPTSWGGSKLKKLRLLTRTSETAEAIFSS
jgi:hypothetical protein